MKTNNNVSKDQEWLEKNILKGGDLFFYGNLYDEVSNISAEVFWKELRTISENYLAAGKERSQIFHQIIDEKLAALIERDKRYGYPPPYCHKGCCNCCHEVIYCTDEEAEAIHKYCQENKISIDYEKIKRQLTHIEVDQKNDHTGITTWNDQKEEDQSCVFLDKTDGACKVWQERPFVCRVHLAEKTNQYCRPHNGEANPNACGINYPEWSYILTSIFTIHKESIKKTMGRLLFTLKD